MLLTDITERRTAQERLHLAASVFASSQEGILITDAESRILDANPACCAMTGFSLDELVGRDTPCARLRASMTGSSTRRCTEPSPRAATGMARSGTVARVAKSFRCG